MMYVQYPIYTGTTGTSITRLPFEFHRILVLAIQLPCIIFMVDERAKVKSKEMGT
jgi:PII-like signaling protein